jgi:cytochrome c-type biogenesis protein CcmE
MATATPPVASTRRIKPVYIAGLAIIAIALYFAWDGLATAARPYTETIAEAQASGRNVQLVGFLGSTGSYDAEGNFVFEMQDETGQMVTVIYTKPKPANFEQAVSLVAIGHYDPAQGAFLADDLLVKCPSKYQEAADSGATHPGQ